VKQNYTLGVTKFILLSSVFHTSVFPGSFVECYLPIVVLLSLLLPCFSYIVTDVISISLSTMLCVPLLVSQSAKVDALKQLHIEHQLRIDFEQKCLEFSRKTSELEQRLLLLQNSRQVIYLCRCLFSDCSSLKTDLLLVYYLVEED